MHPLLPVLLAIGCSRAPYLDQCDGVADAVDDQVACLDDVASLARTDIRDEVEEETRDCRDEACDRDRREHADDAEREVDEARRDAEHDMRNERDVRRRLQRLREALRRMGATVEELRALLRRLRERERDRRDDRRDRDDTGHAERERPSDTGNGGRSRDTGDQGRSRDTGR